MSEGQESELLLRHYFAASDGEAEVVLARILTEIVDPVTARTIRRKLGVWIAQGPNANGSQINEDALGIAANVRLSMISALRQVRNDPAAVAIESVEAYAATVARNAANDYLRRRFPARYRLSNQIRYLLRYDPSLHADTRPDDLRVRTAETVGSLEPAVADDALSSVGTIDEIVERYKGHASVPIRSLIKILLADLARPIMFEELVATVAGIKGIRDLVDSDLPVEELNLPSLGPEPAVRAERKELLRLVWETARDLPLRHRRALLLHLSDDAGDNLLMMFPLEGIASIRSIAACLELELDEFSSIWSRLPLPDVEIAKMMGLERQQVINLRHSARGMLKKRMRNAGILSQDNIA